ncbi:MAG TPA: ABC transporter substrate-binding protein [Ignavibacteria bacterium]|nr:ABC transporter substrate-binding protein [Ignavibacteria bacterium]HMR41348.1 ABC transporter substrate-binding protein [Ignavibacteria bacterium]
MTKIKLLIAILILPVIIISCGRQKETVQESTNSTFPITQLTPVDTQNAVTGDWIIKQIMSDAEKINPIVTNDATASSIITYIFENLLEIDRVTYELKPLIAKSLPEISEDHLTYTFDLKEDVTFSDGAPLTGEDIIFTVKVIKNPFTDAQALRNYFNDVKSVELVDGNKYKVKFTMTKPYFRAIYSLGDLEIIPGHLLDLEGMNKKFTWTDLEDAQKTFDAKKYPEMSRFADFINSQEVARDPKYVVGSGPYVLDKWITGQSVTLKRNENYWNKSELPNYPEKIIFKTIKDQNAAVVAAKNKEIDEMQVYQPVDFVENVKNPEEYKLKKALVIEPSYNYIAWNNSSQLFSDKRVRWAMGYAINREDIIDKIVYGMGTPIQSHVFLKSKYLNSDLPEIPYDINKAKQLLSEAGWKDTDGDGIIDKVIDGKKVDFKFTFTNNTNPKRKKVILILIEQLRQIGIEASIQEYEWSVFLDKIKKHDYDACFAGWQLSVTPDDPFQIFHSSQSVGEGSNYFSYDNPESDKLLEENRVTFDDEKRKEILDKWQRLVYDDQPVTFLWSEPVRYLYSDRYNNARWYAYPDSPLLNEWWVPSSRQLYKN